MIHIYNVNFSRNGEDAKSNSILVENKCAKSKRRKRCGTLAKCSFAFHAMGDIEHDRYVLAKRDKETFVIETVYDISDIHNVKKIYDNLLKQKEDWLERGSKDQSKMKHDVIYLKEDFLETLTLTHEPKVSSCKVFRG